MKKKLLSSREASHKGPIIVIMSIRDAYNDPLYPIEVKDIKKAPVISDHPPGRKSNDNPYLINVIQDK